MLQRLGDQALIWLPLILMALLVFLVWRTLRLVPRTKPTVITPTSKSSVTFSDVAGVDEAKGELREVVDFLVDAGRFEKLGARVPKGILLYGPPGTGKTLLAKAVAHESRANFFSQSASAFVEMFAGLGAARIRKLFETARHSAPAIIFIDELDAVGQHRGFDVSKEKDQTLNQLLVELDGFEAQEGVVVVAASNRLDSLDQALLRPGRFDRHILVSPPDLAGREAILKVHTRNKPLRGVDLKIVAKQSSGLTGADLANICNEAAIIAGRHRRSYISSTDFQQSLERVIAGMQTRKIISRQEKTTIAYHEAGHALVSRLAGSSFAVQKVSILPRGESLGYTLSLPEEERFLRTKEELQDLMKILLAGRAAEKIKFNKITNGAQNDLEKVTQISRDMIFNYGMSSILGSRTLRAEDYALSEETKRLRDQEQQKLTDQAYREAEMVINTNLDKLEALAEALMEREILEFEDIDRILSGGG